MRSVTVVLPASIWAIMPIFRIAPNEPSTAPDIVVVVTLVSFYPNSPRLFTLHQAIYIHPSVSFAKKIMLQKEKTLKFFQR
jgi:hypothetical protein